MQDIRLLKFPCMSRHECILASGSTKLISKSTNTSEYLKMGYFILYPNTTKDSLRMNKYEYIQMKQIVIFSKTMKLNFVEKNWCPFVYKKEILFVYSIVPLIILNFDKSSENTIKSKELIPFHGGINETYKIVHGDGNKQQLVISDIQYVSIFSKTTCYGNVKWVFGDYRGGTPLLNIRNQFYLGFFHSRGAKYYTLGAFTISLHPPFKLLSISPRPITSNIFYPSNLDKFRLIVFPMTFYLANEDDSEIQKGQNERNSTGTKVRLTIGLNDADTGIVHLNLNILLNSLQSTRC